MATSPLQAFTLPDLSDPPNLPGQLATVVGQIEKRVAMRFTTVAARDAAIPSPEEGMVVGLTTDNIVTYYDGVAWRIVAIPGAWTAPTFINSWVNFGGGDQVAEYRKVGDMVQLRGRIKSGTLTQPAFTLPAGFRPPANLWFAHQSNALFGAVYITNGGAVQPYYGSNTDQSINCQFSTI